MDGKYAVLLVVVLVVGGAIAWYGVYDTGQRALPTAGTYIYETTFHIFDCIEFHVASGTLTITPDEPEMFPDRELVGDVALAVIPPGNYRTLTNELLRWGITTYDPESFVTRFSNYPFEQRLALFAEMAVAYSRTPTLVFVTADPVTIETWKPAFLKEGVLVNGTLYDGTTLITDPGLWISEQLTSASGGRYIWVLKIPVVPTVDHWGVMNTFYYANLSPGIPTNTTRSFCG